MDQEEKYPL